jgi:hypothetical protein
MSSTFRVSSRSSDRGFSFSENERVTGLRDAAGDGRFSPVSLECSVHQMFATTAALQVAAS